MVHKEEAYIKNDPRNKLEIAHMVLFRLANDKFIDQSSMANAKKEIDEFLYFLEKRKNKYSFIPEIIDLLTPTQKIFELHLNNETSMRAMMEVVLLDFDKAMEMVGKVMDGENPSHTL